MIEIKGQYADAHIMVPNESDLEQYARAQIQMICDFEANDCNEIVIMPDVHPGKIGPIGLVMRINSGRIMPGLIGPDIGCGMTVIKLDKFRKDFDKLDNTIEKYIVPKATERNISPMLLEEAKWYYETMYCYPNLKSKEKFINCIGSLGGGNHFIEIGVDEDEQYYLTIHSGSRLLGFILYEHYMKSGQEALKKEGIEVPYEMTYLTGDLAEEYLCDIAMVTRFAKYNRLGIADIIFKQCKKSISAKYYDGINQNIMDAIDVPHNYVEERHNNKPGILRKGAIAAYHDQDVVIPANMKDGIILGKGKGNPNWLASAPHGSGRLYSRLDVANHYTVNQFKKDMDKIHCSNIGKDTLSESPCAYRSIDYLKEAIKDTVNIEHIIKPVYNYKSGDEK